MSAKKRFPLFYKIYFAVIAVAVVAIVFGMFWLKGYLAEYESSQPYIVADDVFEKYYSSNDFSELVGLTYDEDSFESPEVITEHLQKSYGDCELTYTSVSSGEKGILKYIVKAGDKKISSFTLKESDKTTERGFKLYTQNTFEVYYPANESVTVLVPEFSDVYVNDIKLDSGFAVESGIILDDINDIPEGISPVKYDKYTVEGLIKSPSLKVMSGDVENNLVYNEETKEYKADLPNDSDLQALYSDFVIEAVKEYAKYMEMDSHWGKVKPYFDPTTKLYTSIYTVEQYFVYPHSGYRFEEEYAGDFYAYDENTFSCRVSVLQILENPGMEDFKDNINMTVYLRRVGEQFLIYDWNVIGE
ncbi:MAG: hypothetical protein E7578_07975 [Ruminococcaceae bacterium]|nr:hypothetical protein [Oscillospiraceae bacterium]